MAPLLNHSHAISDAIESLFASSTTFRACFNHSSLVLVTAILMHWTACTMAMFGTEWLSSYQNAGTSAWRMYKTALYWAVTTMTTLGWGDITPKTDMERLFSMLAMLVSCSFYGYCIGTITNVISNRDLNAVEYHNKLDFVYAWVDHHGFPRELRTRVIKYFKAHYQDKSAMNDVDLLFELSPNLQKDVGHYLVHTDLMHHPLFDGLADNNVAFLQKVVRKLGVDKGQVIINAAESGTAMFILFSGNAELTRPDGTLTKTLHPGSSFGEEILAGIAERYIFTVRALADVKLYAIDEGIFFSSFQHMPDVIDLVQSNARGLFLHHMRPARSGSLIGF